MADRDPKPPFRYRMGSDSAGRPQEFAFADVGADGRLAYVSPFGQARWGWHAGDTVPDEVRFMLFELGPGASQELPFLQGGLCVHGVGRSEAEGWMIVGYERRAEMDETATEPLDTLIRDMPVCAVRMQPDGTVVYANPEAVRMTGYPLDEIAGCRFWSRVIVEEDRPAFEDALRRVDPDVGVETRFAYRTADAAVQHVTMHLFLTEAYFVEAVVLDRPWDPDDALLLRAATGTMGRTGRDGRLLATVAHEIRSPLGALRGYVDLLTRELANAGSTHTEIPDALREIACVIDDRVRRLAALVQDLAELSAMEQGQVMAERNPVRLHTVILDAAHRAESDAGREGREVILCLEGDPRVLTDGYRLARVLDRVLGRAMNATATNGTITVRVEEGDDHATVEVLVDSTSAVVKDGIQRPAGPGGSLAGSGSTLDLAVARLVMELMDGSITVEHRDAGSTAFRLDLPTAGEPAVA